VFVAGIDWQLLLAVLEKPPRTDAPRRAEHPATHLRTVGGELAQHENLVSIAAMFCAPVPLAFAIIWFPPVVLGLESMWQPPPCCGWPVSAVATGALMAPAASTIGSANRVIAFL